MAYMDVAPPRDPNGQTFVLLHGKNFGGYYWENTIRALGDAGLRVVVPDQVGWGKSSKPDVHYSFDLLAANTAKLLDHLKVDRAVVLGHSTGGMLAVRFARTYPRRVARLVLEDPVGLEDYREKIPPQSTETLFRAELENTDPRKIRAYYASYFPHPDEKVYGPLADVQVRVTQSGEYPRWAKASALAYQMIYQQPVRHEYRLLAVPTLLVVGASDRTVVMRNYAPPEALKTMGDYPRLAREAAKEIPDCKLLILDDTGHIPHLERPGEFHKAVVEFCKR
jgi:pimeloyl-ACP methyl ester carboxylesterase